MGGQLRKQKQKQRKTPFLHSPNNDQLPVFEPQVEMLMFDQSVFTDISDGSDAMTRYQTTSSFIAGG